MVHEIWPLLPASALLQGDRLLAAVLQDLSFDAARKLILKFQEVSPWTTFGHVAANSTIPEDLDRESKIHIIDISNTLCTQWPLLEAAVATRNDETPRLKQTVVVVASIVQAVMKEMGGMEKFT
ncbi:hypothetical protein MLD38_010695 [Melastoma candidum]|uniref:Uncharacterized protein n=1 Tax=Melastoma candidum TaxID=119954 RepID=A0ACB9R4S9_9MYRT|nr:hypothetical protein MLD38_010695 [Melastoma candidum]